MSISVSKYISYNSSTTTYTIKRKGCKIVCDSDIGEAIGSKSSCNTSKKATLSMLNEYYEIYGTERSKKYKTVDIKIEYNTVEEIIAAIKVFVLAHKQIPIDTIQLTDQFIKHKSITKTDTKTLQTFLKTYAKDAYNPPNKKRKLNDGTGTPTDEYDDSNPIVNIIKTVVTSIFLLFLKPIQVTINSILDYSKSNSSMLSDMHEHMRPVNMNTVGKRYRPMFQLDIYNICDHFFEKLSTKDKEIEKLNKKVIKLTKSRNCWKSKCHRKEKTLDRMRTNVGQSKIVDLKVAIDVKHQRFRDKTVKKLILSLKNNNIESEQDFNKYIFRQFDILYRKNAKFQKQIIDRAFKDVIQIVNKNGRSRELDVQEAQRWLVLKLCAGLTQSKYQILHGKLIWDEYTDDKGKIRKKRIENDDGTVATFGCSRYMMDKGLTSILAEYPEFEYKNIFQGSVYHSSLIRLLLIYLTIFTVSADMQVKFMLSEQNVQKRFASQLEALGEGERLELDFGTFRAVDYIDGTPLKNVTFGSGTNWVFIIDDLFESGWNGATLQAVHHAFSVKKDTSTTTTAFNDTILECELCTLQNDGIILSFPNLPIDAIIRLDTRFNGDMPLTASLKFAIHHTGDFGRICDTLILYKDANSLKTEVWVYNLTPEWMYKDEYDEMAKHERIDNWREYDYIALPDKFIVHLTPDIHCYANDKIDDYIMKHPELNFDIHNIEHRQKVAKILKFAIYNRCNSRALWFNFEWLHAATGVTGGINDLIIDDCRNTMNLKNETIIAGAALVGHSGYQKGVISGLNSTAKDKKIGSHYNGNISKCIINTICSFLIYLMPYCDTEREVLMIMSYVLIVISLSYIFWGALWAISHSDVSVDTILDNMEQKVNQIWNALTIFPRIQSKIPYILRLKFEAIPQLRLYIKDELNIHKRGGESNSTQTIECIQCGVKKLFANHMNKSDEKKGIQTVFVYHHIKTALGLKYGVYKIKQKSDSFHWREEDLFHDFDSNAFIIGEHVELNPNSTAEKLFDSVKQSLISGVPPNCYESKSDYIEDTDEKTDNSEQDVIGNDDLANLDGLEIRNVEQLSQHLEIDLEDQDESSDDDDDDDYIDPDF
eukprot:508182_1